MRSVIEIIKVARASDATSAYGTSVGGWSLFELQI